MTGPRVDSAGFHLGIAPHVWWFTQSRVLFMYLRLAIWPWPLLIHYELPYVTFAEAWLYVVPLSFIGLLTFVLLLRNRPLGFLGTWFFVILAPTFVIPVVTEMAAERRMYLALVPLAVIFVVGGYRLAGFVAARLGSSQPRSQFPLHSLVSGGIAAALALIFCFVSATRLAAYESETTLWLQVLQSQPENPRAHLYVANLLESQGKIDDAVEEYRETIRLHPNPVQAHYRLGLLLNKTGAHDEAAAELGKAIRGLPNKSAAMQNDLGVALYMAGRNDEAIQAYRDTLAIDPDFWPAHRNLGTALQKAGKLQEATKSFETALRLNPKTFDVYFDLANAHSQLNQPPQAIAALERGLAAAQAANDVKAVEKFSAELKAKNR
jgi:tetratricopeptide (TPR) repeat protein